MTKKDNTSLKYRIDENNRLVVNQKTKLDGKWSLTKEHDLVLKLSGTKDSKSGDKVLINGVVKDVTKNALLFEVSKHSDLEIQETYTLTLKGTWNADKYNRLIFSVKKENGLHDILTFSNSWIINKKHRIVYKYEKADLILKRKRTHEITFKGYWNLTDDNRLYYEMDKDSDSRFDFNIGIGAFEKRRIKYKIMVGKKSQEKEITIGGQWKISKDLGVTFEVDYGENEVKPISLGTKWDLSGDTTLGLKIKDGIELKLDHEWLDGAGKAFVKYHQGLNSNKVDWGLGLKF